MLPNKTAADFMRTKPVTLSPDMDLSTAMKVFRKHMLSGAPVVDARGHLVGFLSEKDCLRTLVSRVYFSHPGARVGELMSREVRTITLEASLQQVADIFMSTAYRRLPVVHGDLLVGQVSRGDFLQVLHNLMGQENSALPVGHERLAHESHDLLREVVGPGLLRRFA